VSSRLRVILPLRLAFGSLVEQRRAYPYILAHNPGFPALMATQDIISALTLLFMVGMIWLRTRMQYAQQVRGGLRLQRAGRMYFAAAVLTLVLGWLLAPPLGRLAWPGTAMATSPVLMRAIWALGTYYVFILVHRVLKARGVALYQGAPVTL